jgi:S-(hydroxymethyl)glutathione dehydrogenase/alcohol dehydrogenase
MAANSRLAGAGEIIAVDLDPAKLALAERVGATSVVDARSEDPAAVAKAMTGGRGADVVLEAAGSPASFRASVEAVRPGGEVIWLGKTDVAHDVAFRWGSLMGERRIRLISRHIALDEINDGFAALERGETIRSVVMF